MGDTIQDEFQAAISCEKLAAAVYRGFMKKFAHVPEIKEFWNDLVKDEVKHAKGLEEVFESLTDEQRSEPADSRLIRELRRILALRSEDVAGPVETLDDAFNIANELEDSEVNAAFRSLTKEFIPKEEYRKALLDTLEVHLARLTYFSENYGDSAWRKSIKAK